MRRNPFLAGALAAGSIAAALALSLHAQPHDAAQDSAASGKDRQPAAQAASQAGDEGQNVFERNCSRCHNAPEGFSPRISGTIARHMRVRANLSEHDEQELLRFLNP